MRKVVVAAVIAGLLNAAAIDSLRACGGGCGAMGGGGGRAYGGRMAAGRKIYAGGTTVQGRVQVARQASAPASHVAAEVKANRAPIVRTAASRGTTAAKSTTNPPLYSCPMHPQVQWTKPTDCPICGMQLKLKRPQAAAPNAQSPSARIETGADETVSDSASMDDMMCPGCMMNMHGMSGAGGKQAPAASSNATGRPARAMAGMGCGC